MIYGLEDVKKIPQWCAIKRVNNSKYLVVIVDLYMKWKEHHILNIVNRTYYLVFVFVKLRKLVSTDVLVKIYYGLFNCLASYGIIAWGVIYNNIV